MNNDNERETGARKLQPKRFQDANDDFSKEAANNRKPPLGIGLTENISERSEVDKSDFQDASAGTPEADAQGQSEKNHAGGANDGVSSANPRVISGNESGDATFPFKREK